MQDAVDIPKKVKLTKAMIDALPLASNGKQVSVMDTELKGFGLRIGATSKTFIVYKRLPHGAPQRVSLGKYGALTVDQARKKAQEHLSALVQGVDINAQKKAVKLEKKKEEAAATETFEWLLDLYKTEHIINYKGGSEGTLRSLRDTKNFMREREVTLLQQAKDGKWKEDKKLLLSDWLSRPFREIKGKEVLERHDFFARARPKRLLGGELKPIGRTHQIAFKFAQAAFNFYIPRLMEETGEELKNPFDILKTYKRWTAVNVRERHIDFNDVDETGAWLEALQDYRKIASVPADFILFSLLQAARGIEVRALKWKDVVFKERYVIYRGTKNKLNYKFPLSDEAYAILKRRKEENPKESEWVWHYPKSKTGHIPDDAKHHFHEITALGGKYVSSHDLKRTWGTAADNLNLKLRDVNYLLKHKEKNDVNDPYFVRNRAKLLIILQSVEDILFAQHKAYLAKKKLEQPVVEKA